MRLQTAARLVTFVLITAYTLGGPLYRQVLGSRNPVFGHWVMFSGANLDVCEVEFRLAGHAEPLDRYALLEEDPWYEARSSVRKLRNMDDVRRQGRQLCSRLGRGTDLRASVRCAQRSGWKSMMRGDVDLCTVTVERTKAAGPLDGRLD